MYNVVFEGVGGDNSNYKGVRTITSFESKEAFDEWKKNSTNRDRVIAEGISDEEASEIAGQMTLEARQHALDEQIAADPAHAEMHRVNMLFALHADVRAGYFPDDYVEKD